MEELTSLKLEYSSTRREVTKFYFWMWRRTLWKVHALCFVAAIVSVIAFSGKWSPAPLQIIYGLLIALGVILCLFLFPQIMFKPQVRTMVLDRQGLRTTIGRRTGNIEWSEIQSIEETSDTFVILGKSKNAFLVPRRALSSDEECAKALTAIRTWIGAYGVAKAE